MLNQGHRKVAHEVRVEWGIPKGLGPVARRGERVLEEGYVFLRQSLDQER